ncbi:MAG TPA: hypothetical protein VFK38_02965 [Candidatus Limnocylindrales bacterium]|nr:hypothetical protein [Candidatus Limnocylindrales bacterium]
MDEFAQHRGWWGYHWAPPQPLSITRIIASGSLDAELAALLWLLVEGRLPVLVAAEAPLAGKSTTLTALMDFLPPGTHKLFLRGWAETFDWLPDADRLGWPGWQEALAEGAGVSARDPRVRGRLAQLQRRMEEETGGESQPRAADPATTYLLASELSSHLPVYTWGVQARILVRALQRGYGLGSSMHADSLEEVFSELGTPPVGLTEDELRWLGVVIVLRLVGEDGAALHFPEGSLEAEMGPLQPWVRRRAVAVHYLRPPERDGAGHVQRRPPAVLATWDPATDCFEHFAWGVTPELALRVGRTQADFEGEQEARAAYLRGLVEGGVFGVPAVRRAIDGYRESTGARGDN